MGLYFIVAYQYPVATTSVKNLQDETKASPAGSLWEITGTVPVAQSKWARIPANPFTNITNITNITNK